MVWFTVASKKNRMLIYIYFLTKDEIITVETLKIVIQNVEDISRKIVHAYGLEELTSYMCSYYLKQFTDL